MVVLEILFFAVLITALIVGFGFLSWVEYGDPEKVKNKIGKHWYWVIWVILGLLYGLVKTFGKSHGG